ncbi:MAG: serpin family protein [bacterium]|nr:serpin family protein [bacterium]MDD6901137.1 serpin family protein [bacterium]
MKKSILYYLLWCLIMSVALVSCSDDNESGSGVENEQPAVYTIKLTAPQKKVLSQSNDFAFDVLKSINDENTNNFVSPYSLGQALAMLANGAEGETYDEIARVLKIGDGASLADINTFYATMNQALTSIKSSAKFAVANSLWTNQKYDSYLLDSYKTDMLTHYGAQVQALDFSDAGSVETINKWANKQTNGAIPSIVKATDSESHALLFNSLYFKGLWKYFPKKNTHHEMFRNQFDRNENVKMMESDITAINGFISDDELMAEFDYGGKAFQLQIIMPIKQKINDYIAELNGEKYVQMLTEMQSTETIVTMPKFKHSYENQLIENMKKMGICRVFNEDAQLGKLSSYRGLSVTKLQQNTLIEVNEEGTTAAAVTMGEIGPTANVLPSRFIIDHPFIYIIRERTTGVILFIGKVQTMEGMQ